MTKFLPLLLMFFLALPANAAIIIQGAPAAGGGSQVTMMTVAASGEFGTNARTPIPDGGAAEFKYPFGSGDAGSEATETTDEAFGIIPIDGEFRAIRLYSDYGGLDSTEDLELTLRECSGGDLTSCTWTDTVVTDTAVGDGSTTTWTNSGLSFAVTAGDVFTMKIQHPGTTGASVPSGAQETVNYLLEFVGDNDDESFLTATLNKGSGGGVFFPIVGATTADFSNAGEATMTMPGSFTLTALHGARNSTSNARSVYLCDNASGSDANCGGVGTELASCDFADSSDTCSDTGLSVSLTTDSDLYYRYSNDFEPFAVTVGMALESASQEWVSGTCHGANLLTDDSTEGGFGGANTTPGAFGYYCNQFNADRGCETALITEAVAKHMVGYTNSTPAADGSDEFNVYVAEGSVGGSGATNSSLSCLMSQNDTDCIGTTDVTIEAENTFLYRFSSVGTSDSTNGCWSTLWDSL